jgi:hypothetical protein
MIDIIYFTVKRRDELNIIKSHHKRIKQRGRSYRVLQIRTTIRVTSIYIYIYINGSSIIIISNNVYTKNRINYVCSRIYTINLYVYTYIY